MKNSSKDDTSTKTSAYMKKCGVPDKLHSRMIYYLCDNIYQNKDSTEINYKPLLSSVNILNNAIWADALKIVFEYLNENHMDHTLSTIKIEYPQFQEEKITTNESIYERINDLIQKGSTEKNFHVLVQSFLSDLPLKNTTKSTQLLYPDITSSESLGLDISNISEDNSLNIDSFHEE